MRLKATAGIGLLAAVAIPALVVGYEIPPETQGGSAAEQEVRQAENARREALLRNDIATLDRLIADSYVATLGDGRVVRKAEAGCRIQVDTRFECGDRTDTWRGPTITNPTSTSQSSKARSTSASVTGRIGRPRGRFAPAATLSYQQVLCIPRGPKVKWSRTSTGVGPQPPSTSAERDSPRRLRVVLVV